MILNYVSFYKTNCFQTFLIYWKHTKQNIGRGTGPIQYFLGGVCYLLSSLWGGGHSLWLQQLINCTIKSSFWSRSLFERVSPLCWHMLVLNKLSSFESYSQRTVKFDRFNSFIGHYFFRNFLCENKGRHKSV